MIQTFYNHFHLTWRLLFDQRVSIWLKLFLVLVPVAYASVPLPDDLIPVVGLLDDILFVGLCTIVFNAVCPLTIVSEHRQIISGQTDCTGNNL